MAEPPVSPLPVASPSPTDIFEAGKQMAISFSGHHHPTRTESAINAGLLDGKISQKTCPKDYKKIREKYEKYFEGNRILPIPELVNEVKPKTISFVKTDLKTRRLAGIKKKH